MSRIRLALIGLSASAKTSWASEGHLPYLLSPRGLSKYEISALLNSTTSSAEAARAHYNLPASVKAYGSPDDLANDPDIDLVVCCTRVDVHLSTVLPSLQNGKAAYIEWPLASNLADANILAAAAKSTRTVAGLQVRLSPPLRAVQALLTQGTIGKVLSSDVRAFTSILRASELPEGLAYFADRKVGGSPITIAFGHMIDFVHHVLGEFTTASASWRLQIQRPTVAITGSGGKTIHSDVPDYVAVHGEVTGKPYVAAGASLALTMRNGAAFPGDPGFVWTINGEKGELKITSPAGPYWQLDGGEKITIHVHDYATNAVREEMWKWEAWQEELQFCARSVGDMYEQFAAGAENSDAVPDFADAVVRHRELQGMLDSWDAQLAGEEKTR